ncbi:MAG: cation:proton antiporter [Wujia sp.]
MEHFLIFLIAVLFMIIAFTLFNEKVTKLPNEIVLLVFSLIVGIILSLLIREDLLIPTEPVVGTLSKFRIDKILLDGLLCFMLFTGASELKLPELVNNFKPISLLALLSTVITSALYGLLFWILTSILGMHIGFTLCFLLGSIVSPTDPIAATGILNKLGLSKDVTAIMEGESLFNDGTGVALFIFIKELYLDTKGGNFLGVMCQELFGAIIIGLAVSAVCFLLIRATKDPIKHILISMFSVALSYYICEECDFSGVIASVVCGIYFSTMMEKYKAANADMDPSDYYKDFWKIIDTFLNYVLYVLVGLSFIFVTKIKYMIIIAIAAIVFNIVARFIGVWVSTVACKQLPEGYHIKTLTALMTWSGLKGGLCLALAISAIDFLPSDVYSFVLFVTYVTIIFTTVVQGLTVGRLYKLTQRRAATQSEANATTQSEASATTLSEVGAAVAVTDTDTPTETDKLKTDK